MSEENPSRNEPEEDEDEQQPGPSTSRQETPPEEEDDERSPHRTRTGGTDTMSQLAMMKAQKMQRAGKSTAPRFGPRRSAAQVRSGGLQHLPGTSFTLPPGLEQQLSDVSMTGTPTQFPFSPCDQAPTTTIHRAGPAQEIRRPRRRLIKRFTAQTRPDPFAHFESMDQRETPTRKRGHDEEEEERKSKSSTDDEPEEPATKRMG